MLGFVYPSHFLVWPKMTIQLQSCCFFFPSHSPLTDPFNIRFGFQNEVLSVIWVCCRHGSLLWSNKNTSVFHHLWGSSDIPLLLISGPRCHPWAQLLSPVPRLGYGQALLSLSNTGVNNQAHAVTGSDQDPEMDDDRRRLPISWWGDVNIKPWFFYAKPE